MTWWQAYLIRRAERERAAADARLRARFGMDQADDQEWAVLRGQLLGTRPIRE
jgi:hypothetical protein